MDVSIRVPSGLMFLVICNPTIKNISYLISYLILRQRLSLVQLTCDIYIVPCILACLAFVVLACFMFYMCCCLYLFLNLIFIIIVVLTFS